MVADEPGSTNLHSQADLG